MDISGRHVRSVFVIALALCLAPQAKPDASAIDAYIQPYVASSNFSGVVLVQKNGATIFERAYGGSGNGNTPMSVETRFHVASVSMQFTAAAVLRLIDKKRLTLDTGIEGIVPGVSGGEKITIRDLLTERSGLADINDLPDYSDLLKSHQTPASLVDKIKDRPLLFDPGSKFLHEEHSAYNLLALIIEKKTGMPFAKAMKKLAFDPAGLAHTAIDDDGPQKEEAAQGYQPKGVSGLELAASIHWSAKTGNGSIVTTARDQAGWMRLLFTGDFLSRGSRDLLLSASPSVGYGWFRRENTRFNQTAYYMNGRAPGFASFVLYLPKEDLTVIAFSNIYSSVTTTIGNDLAAIALGLKYEPFQPSNTALTAEKLNSSTGTFKFGPDFYQANAEVKLVSENAELSLRWPSGDVSPLIPIAPDRFLDRAYWEPVVIGRNETGAAARLTYDHFEGHAVGSKP